MRWSLSLLRRLRRVPRPPHVELLDIVGEAFEGPRLMTNQMVKEGRRRADGVESGTDLMAKESRSQSKNESKDQITKETQDVLVENTPRLPRDASEKMAELLTSSNPNLEECEQFILYLDSRTWTSPTAFDLAIDCTRALRAGIPIILLWECDDNSERARYVTAFRSLIWHTPPQLVEWKLYKPVACTLAGGEYRPTSLALALLSVIEGRHRMLRIPRPECVLDGMGRPDAIKLLTRLSQV